MIERIRDKCTGGWIVEFASLSWRLFYNGDLESTVMVIDYRGGKGYQTWFRLDALYPVEMMWNELGKSATHAIETRLGAELPESRALFYAIFKEEV